MPGLFCEIVKAITTPAILTRFSSRVDGSLSFGGVTPELTNTEKVALMDLHNKNVEILIQPTDNEAPEEMVRVKRGMEIKSPGKRLRNVIYILFCQKKPVDQDFQSFYNAYIEKVIQRVKEQLDQA